MLGNIDRCAARVCVCVCERGKECVEIIAVDRGCAECRVSDLQ